METSPPHQAPVSPPFSGKARTYDKGNMMNHAREPLAIKGHVVSPAPRSAPSVTIAIASQY